MPDRIAIQGDKASFHDIAAQQLFGAAGRVFCDTFTDTFAALANDDASNALCAIENSLYGSINEVYDLLLKHDFHISGEVYLRIEQCLVGLPGAKIETIAKVYSHPVALAQCEDYLDTALSHAEREEYHDTAASAELVKKLGDPTITAIASTAAAELHGLQILAHSIETNKENYTRFVSLSKTVASGPGRGKSSLVLRTSHAPGALHAALGCFANRSINLTKLQSRPIIGKAWHYMFYIDLEVDADSPLLDAALDELTAQGCRVNVLGSYVSGQSA